MTDEILLNTLQTIAARATGLPPATSALSPRGPQAYSAALIQAHLRAYADWVEAEFPAGRAAATACLGLIEHRRNVVDELSAANPALCFCKADPRFANVIQRPDGRLGLIDWEDS